MAIRLVDSAANLSLFAASEPRHSFAKCDDVELFRSAPPAQQIVVDHVPQEYAESCYFALGFDGPILFQFANPATGESVLSSSTSLDGASQKWGNSRTFGELLHELFTPDQAALFAEVPAKGTFRVWQVSHPTLCAGSLLPPQVLLLDTATSTPEGWKHSQPDGVISIEQARDALFAYNLQAETVIAYDRSTHLPVARLISPPYNYRSQVQNQDPNITRCLFRVAHDLSPTHEDPIQAAYGILLACVHPLRRAELHEALWAIHNGPALLGAHLLREMNAGRELQSQYLDLVSDDARGAVLTLLTTPVQLNYKATLRRTALLEFLAKPHRVPLLDRIVRAANQEGYASLGRFYSGFEKVLC